MQMSVRINPETGKLEHERKLRGSGGSTVLSIPPSILESAGVGDGDAVTISIAPGSDTIEISASEE